MQEEKKKAPSSQAPLQGTPLRDIMEKDEAWESTLSWSERLALAYLRMRHFGWDTDVLGAPPKCIGADNATAIEDVVGVAEISRFEKMEVYGWTYDQWLRWYTVERVNEERAVERERWREIDREERIRTALQLLVLLALIAGFIAITLLGAR